MAAFYLFGADRRSIGLAAGDRAAQSDLQRAAADRVVRRAVGLYVLLDAPFVAVIQIIVYAGAIMVLFLFVVMLLNAPHEDTELRRARRIRCCAPAPMRFGAVLALALVVELVWALTRGRRRRRASATPVELGRGDRRARCSPTTHFRSR